MAKILSSINSPKDMKSLNLDELNNLSDEIRELIIKTVSKNGGHLASNLGVIETTVALHKVFDLEKDKLIFDVGHQCYAHKILTGRREIFSSLRQENGISGFPKRDESEYDAFNTGHSSTSISAAVGMARARDIKGLDHEVIALIGDGALTGGMVWEALNDIGESMEKIIIIINDNEMSINKNVGTMSKYFSNLRSRYGYVHTKGVVNKVLNAIPLIGPTLSHFVEKVKDMIKYLFLPNVLFEEMGFKYYGIIDGHDMQGMITILNHCKELDYPSIIHIHTKKGNGCDYATKNPQLYHSTGTFDITTGEKALNNKHELPNAMTDELDKMLAKDSRICVITAGMEQGCGLDTFRAKHPKRFFDVGIAEQHAVTMAAGLVAGGMKPCFCVYSTFLQRAYDQIIHDVCMQNLPVVFLVYNSGIAGNDGETHQGVFDISFLRHIPNMNVFSPASIQEAKQMLNVAYESTHSSAILMGSKLPQRNIYNNIDDNIYNWHICTKAKQKKIAIISSSTMLIKAMDAIRMDSLFHVCDVFNARTISPIDTDTLEHITQTYASIVTIEDNLIQGGFGSCVLEHLVNYNYNIKNVTCLGYDDTIIAHGSKDYIYAKYSLDANGISNSLKQILGKE